MFASLKSLDTPDDNFATFKSFFASIFFQTKLFRKFYTLLVPFKKQ